MPGPFFIPHPPKAVKTQQKIRKNSVIPLKMSNFAV